MFELLASKPDELAAFSAMEQDADTRDNIKPYSPEQHLEQYRQDDVVYLSIYQNRQLSGFFLLTLEADGVSVEFRRIVIKHKGIGLGQAAISAMEAYCRDWLGRKRIWLDVFEFNLRGQHVYRKLGYRQFAEGSFEGKRLLCMEKSIEA